MLRGESFYDLYTFGREGRTHLEGRTHRLEQETKRLTGIGVDPRHPGVDSGAADRLLVAVAVLLLVLLILPVGRLAIAQGLQVHSNLKEEEHGGWGGKLGKKTDLRTRLASAGESPLDSKLAHRAIA